jgi:hypothetical protein
MMISDTNFSMIALIIYLFFSYLIRIIYQFKIIYIFIIFLVEILEKNLLILNF